LKPAEIRESNSWGMSFEVFVEAGDVLTFFYYLFQVLNILIYILYIQIAVDFISFAEMRLHRR
jgi:hypothetical protein